MSKLNRKLNDDIVTAMKNRDSLKLTVLRMLKSAVQLAQIEKKQEECITDEEFFVIVRRLIKQRREAAEMYSSGGAKDRAELELEEAKILEVYQPAQMSDEDLIKLVAEAGAELEVTCLKDMGKLMGKVIATVKGEADGNRVKNKVQAYLASLSQ